MHIQEIIIDGFKSYGQKTVISGFDPQFNAITGLNGSGKSNILDAICFVLGISNLSQVRVGNLQGLVYKDGNAGVTKASVTIIFNNTDPATSPVGYEAHKQITVTRQVVIGGKNKYMVNGHVVQQSQVTNLFHSVQLNVNNPHFLIMQGRITKVLNMKPVEILSMIEEAAGTRMFETKKQSSIKTIEKKQLKVDEITKCIDEEITPTLENLRTERQIYHEWQANNAEFEQLERFCIACDFQTADNKLKSFATEKQHLEQQESQLLSLQTEKQQQADECNKSIAEIVKRRDESMESEMTTLKSREADASKELVKLTTFLNNHNESLQSERDTVNALTKSLQEVTLGIAQKTEELKTTTAEVQAKQVQSESKEQVYKDMRDKYQSAVSGIANEHTAELLSLPEQILAYEKMSRESASKLQTIEQRRKHTQSELKDCERKLSTQSKAVQHLTAEIESMKQSILVKESQLTALNGGAESVESLDVLRTRKATLQRETRSAQDSIESKTARIAHATRFEYANPERNFDRSQRVKGLVSQLFSLKQREQATALEIVAGGKLHNVVVDNEVTASLLLQKGALRHRVTLLPLNKITHHLVPTEKLMKAKKIAERLNGTAELALDCIVFNEDVRNAMEHVFGTVLVCSSSEIANQIAFDNAIRVKTVTLEGDVFDPSGTLTGGSNDAIGTLLRDLQEIRDCQTAKTHAETQLQTVLSQIAKSEANETQNKSLIDALEQLKYQLKLKEDKLAQSEFSQLQTQINDFQQELENLQSELTHQQELNVKAKSELDILSKTEKDATKARENKLKEFEDVMKSAQKAATSAKSAWVSANARKDAVAMELQSLQKEYDRCKEQLTIATGAVQRLENEAKTLNEKLVIIRSEYEHAKAEVAEKTAELNRASKEIAQLEVSRDKMLKESQAAALEARKLTHKLKQWEKDFKDAEKAILSLLKQHPWIEKEKQFFGQSGTDFDFAAKDVQQCYRRLNGIKSDQEKLSKKINKKVMSMIGIAEAEYADLTKKRETILKDKEKIESVIVELDEKKKQALHKTWQQVNKDFASIFKTLLPNTDAKLEPVEGTDVTDGLEIRVAFNGVWKESLTELSGGQRSLLTLSLILSLLLFKPAPMYILDEVDSALDLNHTQNIGLMIKNHFSSSQFIVVSLKEGMFNNANVIFRTSLNDGQSCVTRTVAGFRAKNAVGGPVAAITNHSAAAAAAVDEDEDELESAPAKKKGKVSSKSKALATDAL